MERGIRLDTIILSPFGGTIRFSPNEDADVRQSLLFILNTTEIATYTEQERSMLADIGRRLTKGDNLLVLDKPHYDLLKRAADKNNNLMLPAWQAITSVIDGATFIPEVEHEGENHAKGIEEL